MLYQHDVLAYLFWELMIYDLNLTFIKSLEKKATSWIKKWAGIFKNSIVSLIYRPHQELGLGVTSLSERFKRAQISKYLLLKNSRDPKITKIYELMKEEQNGFLSKWKPIPCLEELEDQINFETDFAGQTDRQGLGFDKDRYRKTFTSQQWRIKVAEKLSNQKTHDYKAEDGGKALQGGWTRFEDVRPFDMSWTHLIGTRNPKLITWVLNASTNSLVTPCMLKLWGYTSHDRCSLCEGQGSLFLSMLCVLSW